MRLVEVSMGVVQVRLPDDIGEAIEREVAAGHASSAEDYVAHALREYLSAGRELAAEARAGLVDIEAGRFTIVDDLDAWGAANLKRVGEQAAE